MLTKSEALVTCFIPENKISWEFQACYHEETLLLTQRPVHQADIEIDAIKKEAEISILEGSFLVYSPSPKGQWFGCLSVIQEDLRVQYLAVAPTERLEDVVLKVGHLRKQKGLSVWLK